MAIAGNKGKGKAEEELLEFQNISFSRIISWLRQRVHWNYLRFTDEERGLGREWGYLRPTAGKSHPCSQSSQPVAGGQKVFAEMVPSRCSCPEAPQAGSSAKAAREIKLA